MNRDPLELASLSDLRDYVYNTLCELDELRPGAFPMSERILLRKGSPCGIHFCLHGPRSVKYTAIWETDRNSVLFYAPNGERFLQAWLEEAPALSAVA